MLLLVKSAIANPAIVACAGNAAIMLLLT